MARRIADDATMIVLGPRRFVACLLFAAWLPAQGQIAPSSTELATELASLQADPQLAAGDKTAAVAATQRAIEATTRAAASLAATHQFQAQKDSAPSRLQAAQQELTTLERTEANPLPDGLALPELEVRFATAQAALHAAQKAASGLEAEHQRRAERRAFIATRGAELEARLATMPLQLPDEPQIVPRLRHAQRRALAAERADAAAELSSLRAELNLLDAESELQRASRMLAARAVVAASAELEQVQAPLLAARAGAAHRAEQDANVAQLLADPKLKQLAAANAQLARAAAQLVELREQATVEQNRCQSDLAELRKGYADLLRRSEFASGTSAFGSLLRQRRAQLQQTARHITAQEKNREEETATAQLRSLEYDERLHQLVQDPERWLLGQLGEGAVLQDLQPALLAEARRLRNAHRDLLTALSNGYENLVESSVDLKALDGTRSELLRDYERFVTERVLSIKSSRPVWQFDTAAAYQAVAWLADWSRWRALGNDLLPAVLAVDWPMLVCLALLLLLFLRPQLQRSLADCGEKAARGSTTSFRLTNLATLYTGLLSMALPGLLICLGNVAQLGSSDFARPMGAGLIQLGLSLLPRLVLRALLLPKGLAEAHFLWLPHTVKRLRALLPWLLAAAPLSFLLTALEVQGEAAWVSSLGASALALQLVLFLLAFWQLLRPSTGLFAAPTAVRAWVARFSRVWFFVCVGTPMLLLAMIALGYDYTALQFTNRIFASFDVVLAACVLDALIMRALLLARRKWQGERLQQHKLAVQAGGVEATVASEHENPQLLARRTQGLVGGAVALLAAFVLFRIWVDVLPVLGALRRVTLWSIDNPSGTATPVSLADLALCIALLLAAMLAARGLPAVLELLLLQRLRIQPGERYAVTTLARYLIVVAGLVAGFAAIGIGWGKVQWLVAAISVGLGFGMQEIFANFVSGLILLIERPIRVGDVVQVGTTIGRVTRIRIRATTVLDAERKELIVPNREFVTNQFVNWTLSDNVVRRSILVGVAYGSDVPQALRLLLECAARSAAVLAEPAPEALFVGFGDSTLNLDLRVFVEQPTLDNQVISALMLDIERAFREAKLEFAFPQRDVHLDLSARTIELLRHQA